MDLSEGSLSFRRQRKIWDGYPTSASEIPDRLAILLHRTLGIARNGGHDEKGCLKEEQLVAFKLEKDQHR